MSRRARNGPMPRRRQFWPKQLVTRARLLHISTDFVFDGAASVPYSPDAPTNPINVYGKTKRAGELSILNVYPTGSVIVRTSWVYGSRGRNFALAILRLLKEKGMARVVSDQIG